ncbi:barstar family protein [Phytohabitans kaempferiae]|uniref:Barstar family protein n=1 Tax=Phytohabitans kaempferiae TaxID=1620943 RepID=A0ABV6M4I6_9ACTN
MTTRLVAVLGGVRPPGVYRWLSRAHPSAVRRELAAAGWAVHPLDGRALTGRLDLFDRCAEELAFPGWFGRNWNAFSDCLGDLSWLTGAGHVLLWEHYGTLARTDPKAWQQAYQVFDGAIGARATAGVPPLYVLLRGVGPVEEPDGAGTIPML